MFRFTARLTLILALLALAGVLSAQAPAPEMRYRDLKVYTVSTVEPRSAETIVAQTQFLNYGRTPLVIKARLNPCKPIGFLGSEYATMLQPGQTAVWVWRFTPPAGVEREILSGAIALNGKPERDLYVAVQGADPADFADKDVERITERARVTATFAPRCRESILAALRQRAAQAPPPALTLAADGTTAYTIVAEVPREPLREAIDDLCRVITVQSGAELPVAEQADGPAIRLRLADPGAAAAKRHDAYRLRTDGQDVLIEAANIDGLRHGIYGLLTDHLGACWFQPRQLGEEIAVPKDRAVRLPALDEVRGSRWFSASGATWGYDGTWDRRNRAIVNRGRMNFGHAWSTFISNANYPYEKYPEYYARDREGKLLLFDKGWSYTNFCSTNPEVIDIVAKKLNARFAADPTAIIASLDPNDYAPMCLCDRCLALDRQSGQTKEDGTDVADRLLVFSRAVHDRLEPRFKDRFLGILIYGYQMELPKSVKPHDRHAGLICNFPPRYDHSRPWNDPTSEKNRDFYRLLKGWGGQLQQLGYYDYYGHYYYFGPFAVVQKMREDLPAFHELGGTFLMLEAQPNFGIQGLNHYVAARLIWDLDADVDLLLEEYYTRYYGPAAEPMRAFWETAERYYALERPGTRTEVHVAMRPDFWAKLDVLLTQAQTATANLPADQQRFADRVALHRDGFDYAALRSRYDYEFNRRPRLTGQPIDRAAAIAFLREHRATLEGLQQRYPHTDPYWPVMVREYFHLDIDAEIARHQAALKE